MATKKVTCVSKPDRYSKHEHITHIGGVTPLGRWQLTREEAIRRIDQRVDTFYTVDPSDSTNVAVVGVVRPQNGQAPYLRTWADGDWKDNLLALNECPLR